MTQAERLGASFHRLLRENFRSGFDPASIIDRKKFGRAYRSLAGPESSEPEEAELRAEAARSCLEWDGKFYAIDPDARPFLEEAIAGMARAGTNLVNVDIFFRKFGPEFLKLGLISPGLFREFLRGMLGCQKLPNYLRLNPKEDLAGEFTRKLGDLTYLPQKKLEELFPFLTADDAARWAGKYLHYASLRNGDLYLPSAVEFDENEWQAELAKIKREVAGQGYFFLSQLDLSRTRANCPDLPDPVFMAALERKLGEEGLVLKGQIISPAQKVKQLSKLIAGYCRQQEKFTFDDIQLVFGKNAPNSYSSWFNSICIKNAIQVDYNNFISLHFLHFDIEEIDGCLEKIFGRDPFTIISFKNYHLLPFISDYSWNKYLLQSYLLNFSIKYKFISPAPNRKCIGIGCLKDITADSYHDLAANMAMRAGIAPEPNALSAYLISMGIYANFWPQAISRIIKLMAA